MDLNDEYSVFIEQCSRYLQMNVPRIERCVNLVNESQIWWAPNTESNSIGNLILHLCGNITQYINSGLANERDTRDRDAEFSSSSNYSKSELLAKLRNDVTNAINIIKKTKKPAARRMYQLQGFEMTGIEAIVHVTEHFSYHTGQIALLTKILLNQDLGFYEGINLNKKNK